MQALVPSAWLCTGSPETKMIHCGMIIQNKHRTTQAIARSLSHFRCCLCHCLRTPRVLQYVWYIDRYAEWITGCLCIMSRGMCMQQVSFILINTNRSSEQLGCQYPRLCKEISTLSMHLLSEPTYLPIHSKPLFVIFRGTGPRTRSLYRCACAPGKSSNTLHVMMIAFVELIFVCVQNSFGGGPGTVHPVQNRRGGRFLRASGGDFWGFRYMFVT